MSTVEHQKVHKRKDYFLKSKSYRSRIKIIMLHSESKNTYQILYEFDE